MENLSFNYLDSDEYVLKDMNFEIKVGEMVGILGKIGFGKFILVELLFYVY